MNVSPAQRLVNYLREFPPVRPPERPATMPAAEPADKTRAAAQPAGPPPRMASPRPAATVDGAPRRLLPRGSLVNIIT